ncbi:MAG: isoleucine--tRNA ligase [Candidatus Levybacteria bacterium CG_4_9_14_3_um_filter_35_16]|nr:MAG: isoleucine--tRNA ligase [Candidatus Levybacteria bacterium CG22_combo_CG10-13_8_21_14_all_35_11]PIY94837.1 MAG: isoleucine--tRNA ligase [Candidatus Levybacteria bacterium CG_4_10_14_0_8_um_filter_35_23]PJA00856.1 MAG: isoleucine--tRNA ligase [Candidatus Levybacteria bacterium CG_4_10_14_0_2_um_filter_35_8]PJA90909.1 MAG: isoleucine--tRNA ligase [Candidatus Levybacteria bacterium CG_4_9_14_3_um_filter_35_16]PJC54581.1 MAG: isoleucine--tRNA ligase [Candidatus Levybacteria bacterium CG_4_9
MFKPVSPQVDFSKLEEEISKYWKKNNIFEKSVQFRPKNKRWTFLDGPPFVTGVPHYGSLLSSLPKDLFGRYWTMKGYRVRRVWGWDGHGLPIENKVENKLEIKRKRDIEEKIGIDKFILECKKYVEQVSAEWEWYIDKIGRWVDFKNAYKTWDTPYMESVMWVFKQMYDKGYIYKGLRVSLFCPHCSTPISNFEVAMDSENYKEISEPANIYKYQLKNNKETYLLAWSTTPWNKIATPALAINPKLIYIKVKQNNEFYILAKDTVKILTNDSYKTIEEIKGKDLIGVEFVPHYDYYEIEKGKRAFITVGADFVTAEEGTGIVTLAAYGEEDLAVMQKENIQLVMHVDDEGTVKGDVPKFGGLYYLKTNKLVNEDLKERNLMYKEENHLHMIPNCWRCHTRLFYAPQDAWFVNIQNLKEKLIKTNEKINWYPKHFKHGRFLKSLENAPDWNISRSRFWGSPVPVWECGCGERFVPGSIAELEKNSDQKVIDLHRPEIDKIFVKCKKCKKLAKRVPEVLDSWIESGSASFAERHFPFEKNIKLEDFFPPDFIAEYTGQIRAWFYTLHVIGVALYESPAFKNVLVEGVILGTDGRKMSKNYGNFPDPKEMLQKYGGDALRLYLLGSSVMRGEDILISEDQYRNQVKGTMLILWNTYNFFITYANIDRWEVNMQKIISNKQETGNVLDKWIISKLNTLILEVTENLEKYNTALPISMVQKFIEDFSTWYIRRSRDRVGLSTDNVQEKESFYCTSYEVLLTLSKLLAPITPFIAEEIYLNLTGYDLSADEAGSVHLTDWPKCDEKLINNDLEKEIILARELVEIGHSQRKQAEVKVRIPFRKGTYSALKEFQEGVLRLIKDELNIEDLEFKNKKNKAITFDVSESNQNLEAGKARDIIRSIQAERKKIGTKIDEFVKVTLPDWPKDFEEEIRKKALINNLSSGEFKVAKND